MKFAALGRTKWLYDAVELAVAHGHEPVLIGTCAASPEYATKEHHFRELAERFGCPFFCSANLNTTERVAQAQASGAEIAISLNWLTLAGAEIRNAFPMGIVNVHAGDLPRYRGNAVVNWAIINGEPEVVLSAHQMEAELDAGAIFLQRRIPLNDETYVGDIFSKMDELVPQLFVDVMNLASTGGLVGRKQSTDQSTWLRCYARHREDSLIDWRQPAETLARVVRASSAPFSGAFCYLENELLLIWKARPVKFPFPYCAAPGQVVEICRESGEVTVACGQDLLALELVSLPSKDHMAPARVISSTRTRLRSHPRSFCNS
jgi:UDP-4-amino-4-deoxy-L-arabinose formyltransferase/UDP-glucuronic acid dehydrogenase (UDP-4-keto-hexauronic acid decarboxylating)